MRVNLVSENRKRAWHFIRMILKNDQRNVRESISVYDDEILSQSIQYPKKPLRYITLILQNLGLLLIFVTYLNRVCDTWNKKNSKKSREQTMRDNNTEIKKLKTMD